MLLIGRRARLAGALLFVCLWPPAVGAQRLPPAVVAVIDHERVLREAVAARSVRAQVDQRRDRYQIELAEAEQRLQARELELGRQRTVLTAEAFAGKREAFEGEVATAQREMQERRRTLDESATRALDRVRAMLVEVVTGMAESRGFNLVLPSSDVLFFSGQIDLTDEVLAEVNRRLPDVEVSFAGE
jgi:Skp family chaperone for outer membrane proteins